MATREEANASTDTGLAVTLTQMKRVCFVGVLLPIASHLSGSYALPTCGQVSAEGWMHCDGAPIPAGLCMQGNTPDLTEGRFLRESTANGRQGGREHFTLSSEHLPAHTHDMSHAHSAASSEAGSHSHEMGSAGNHHHGVWVHHLRTYSHGNPDLVTLVLN